MLIIKMQFGLLHTLLPPPAPHIFFRAFAPFMQSISPIQKCTSVLHPALQISAQHLPLTLMPLSLSRSLPSAPPPPVLQSSSPHSGFAPNTVFPEAPSQSLLTLIPLPLVCLSTTPDAESSRYWGWSILSLSSSLFIHPCVLHACTVGMI